MLRKRKKIKRRYFRTNWQIRASRVRLIDAEGKQIGLFSIHEARKKGQELGLDLVEIAPKAQPPVVKLINFAKFKYQQEKKEREERKKQKGGIKEVRLTPFIGKADLKVRIKRLKNFLKEENRVRVVVKFLGRQITKQNFGHQLIKNLGQEVSSLGEQEGEPKLTGKRLVVFFKPIKKQTNEKKKDKKEDKKVSR